MFGKAAALSMRRLLETNSDSFFFLRIDLVNIFDVFIPQLLRYPNPSDPLNGEAASLLMRDASAYNDKVKRT